MIDSRITFLRYRFASLVLRTRRHFIDKRFSTFYPFLSGNTFRSLCDIHIDSIHNISECSSIIRDLAAVRPPSLHIYCSLSSLETHKERLLFLRFISDSKRSLGDEDCKLSLVLHNGDKVPPEDYLNGLLEFVDTIFSPNIIRESKHLIGIPIGLENFSYNSPSFYNFFYRYHVCATSVPHVLKTNLVHCAFNPHTNLKARKPLLLSIKNSPLGVRNTMTSKDEYQKALLNSFFTLSPPGNGIDCHRTWEAIYLGVVPVLLDGYVSPQLARDLPVHIVSSYEDFLGKDRDFLLDLYYRKISSSSLSKAFVPYWEKKIRGR